MVNRLTMEVDSPLEVDNFYRILKRYSLYVQSHMERTAGVDRGVDPEQFPEWPMAREMMEYIEAANDIREIDRFSPQRDFKPEG